MEPLIPLEPLLPNNPMHLHRPILCADDQSSWIGQKATGLYRNRGTVLKVFSTPFGVQVALLANQNGGLGLQVTELLSAPGRPATHRTAYLRNRRRMRALFVDEPETNPRAHAAWNRRVHLYMHYDFALKYVEAALLEQVQEGDELAYHLGTRVVVVDPEVKRCRFFGLRQKIRVQATPGSQNTVRLWGWSIDGTEDLFLRHDGLGSPLPTLGLI